MSLREAPLGLAVLSLGRNDLPGLCAFACSELADSLLILFPRVLMVRMWPPLAALWALDEAEKVPPSLYRLLASTVVASICLETMPSPGSISLSLLIKF